MSSQQRPPIVTYGEAGLVFMALTWLPLVGGHWVVPPAIGDSILLPWFVVIVLSGLALGRYRGVDPGGILGGGAIGVISGLVVISIAFGSDFVSIVLALIAGVAIAASAVLSWVDQRPHGSRSVLVITLVVGGVLLILITIQFTQ